MDYVHGQLRTSALGTHYTGMCAMQAFKPRLKIISRDRTGTVSGTVPARNKVGSVRSRNISCSGARTC